MVGAQIVFNATAGRGSAKKREASQPIETHGLAEGLLDPASNWVAVLDCLPAPHFRWGLKNNLLTRVAVSSCEQLPTTTASLHRSLTWAQMEHPFFVIVLRPGLST